MWGAILHTTVIELVKRNDLCPELSHTLLSFRYDVVDPRPFLLDSLIFFFFFCQQGLAIFAAPFVIIHSAVSMTTLSDFLTSLLPLPLPSTGSG